MKKKENTGNGWGMLFAMVHDSLYLQWSFLLCYWYFSCIAVKGAWASRSAWAAEGRASPNGEAEVRTGLSFDNPVYRGCVGDHGVYVLDLWLLCSADLVGIFVGYYGACHLFLGLQHCHGCTGVLPCHKTSESNDLSLSLSLSLTLTLTHFSLQDYTYPDFRERTYLNAFHRMAKRHSFDIDRYNTHHVTICNAITQLFPIRYNHLKDAVAEVEGELDRLHDPLQLNLPTPAPDATRQQWY